MQSDGGLGTLLRGEGLQVVVGTDTLAVTLANQLATEGKTTRAVSFRGAAVSGLSPGVEVRGVDPSNPAEAIDACKGARVIYDCFGQAGIDPKRPLAETTSNFLLAAIESGATFVMASHLRRSLSDNEVAERDVLNANTASLAKTAVVRLPQLYGPGVVNQLWKNVFGSAIKGKRAHWIGDPEVKRSFLFVDDAARAMEQVSRAPFAKPLCVAGPKPITGREMIELAFKAAKTRPDIGVWGRGVMLTGWLLAPEAKEFLKLPYDYYVPFVVDSSEFERMFPSFHYTPLDEAMEKTLDWYRAASSD